MMLGGLRCGSRLRGWGLGSAWATAHPVVCARPANHNIRPPNLQHRSRPADHSLARRRSFPFTQTASDASCRTNSDAIATHPDRDCLTATRPWTPTRTATPHRPPWPLAASSPSAQPDGFSRSASIATTMSRRSWRILASRCAMRLNGSTSTCSMFATTTDSMSRLPAQCAPCADDSIDIISRCSRHPASYAARRLAPPARRPPRHVR
jgi:hypothetical protein